MQMLPEDIQLANEHTYSRKFIDQYIDKAIRNDPDMEKKVWHGVALLAEYRSTEYSYDSKNERVQQLETLELEPLVRAVFIAVAYCQTPELFTSVSAQLAGRLQFSDKSDGIKTIAEILAVLCNTDAFDICKTDRFASLCVLSRIPLEERLLTYITNATFLPPMVCTPQTLTGNYSSGYLTHNDSLVLGKHNHHEGDLCLDVLNTQNRTALRLDTDFLSTVEEEPTFALDTGEKIEMWRKFKVQSYAFYTLIATQRNHFHLTHKVDKRGRIYAQGYHVSTQGTSFKKASIELHKQEIVTGA
jgi:hypothetical protein